MTLHLHEIVDSSAHRKGNRSRIELARIEKRHKSRDATGNVPVPAGAKGKKAVLAIPVVETEAWVWVNGKFVGHRPYHEAYERPNELVMDVTDALLPGKTNSIAIRVNTSLNRAAAGGGLQGRVFLYSPLPTK